MVLILFSITLGIFRRWRWSVAMCVCLAIHLPWLFASGRTAGVSETAEKSLTVMVTNVLTHNHRHDDVIADIVDKEPDVVAILELSSPLAAELEKRINVDYPYHIARPMDAGNFGIGVYSRHPFEHAELFALNTEIESIVATFSIDGTRYRFFATHPLPPMGKRNFELRNAHLDQLATRVRDANAQEVLPTIVVGDLNVTPWSPHFSRFVKRAGLDRASGRFTFTPTWYRYPMFPFGLVLDHVLASDSLHAIEHTVGPESGSDHRSVTVSLGI
jgi:endonuclease/exonuclease/phosphatase (EEP) superfamily protein YafD